jgi:hypothetical protein
MNGLVLQEIPHKLFPYVVTQKRRNCIADMFVLRGPCSIEPKPIGETLEPGILANGWDPVVFVMEMISVTRVDGAGGFLAVITSPGFVKTAVLSHTWGKSFVVLSFRNEGNYLFDLVRMLRSYVVEEFPSTLAHFSAVLGECRKVIFILFAAHFILP